MNYFEMESKVRKFTAESGIPPWELQRIAKKMCCCGTCKFFVQHYAKEDNSGPFSDLINYVPLDWGHCDKGNVQHSKKQSTQSCGGWTDV